MTLTPILEQLLQIIVTCKNETHLENHLFNPLDITKQSVFTTNVKMKKSPNLNQIYDS